MFIGDLTASYKIRNHKWPFRVLRSPTFLDPDALALFGFCRVQDLDLRCDMCDIVVYDCNKQHPLKTHCEQSQCAWAHMWAAVMADKQPSLFAWAQGDTDPTGVRMQNLFIRTFTAWPYENTPNLSARSMACAGFIFYPLADESDRVVCPYCEISLDGWEEADDPTQESPSSPVIAPTLIVEPTPATSGLGDDAVFADNLESEAVAEAVVEAVTEISVEAVVGAVELSQETPEPALVTLAAPASTDPAPFASTDSLALVNNDSARAEADPAASANINPVATSELAAPSSPDSAPEKNLNTIPAPEKRLPRTAKKQLAQPTAKPKPKRAKREPKRKSIPIFLSSVIVSDADEPVLDGDMQTENESDDGASVAGVPVFVNDVDISSAVGVPVFVNEYDNARVVGVPVFVEKGKAPRTRKAAASTEKKSEKSPCVPIFASESARARETASEQRRQSGASIVRGSFYATRGKTQPTDDEQSTIAKPAPTSSKKRGRPTKKPPAPLKPLSKRTMSRQNAENIVDTSDRSTRRKPALTQHQEIAKPARSRKQAKSSLENADPQSGTKRAPAFIGKLSISKNSATELTDPSDENDSDSLDVSEAFDEQESSGRVSLTNVGAELTRVQSKIKLVFPEYKSPWSEPNAMALFAEQHPDLKISDFLGMALKESKAQLEEACQEKIDLFYERAMKQL